MPATDFNGKIKIDGPPALKLQFEHVFNKMMNTGDFKNIVLKVINRYGSITYKLVSQNGMGSEALNDKIVIDMNYFKVEYKVKLPEGYEEKFSNIENYDRWLAAVKAYEEANQWKPFTLERHLYHETYHSAEQESAGTRYIVNKDAYENPAIKATNIYLEKYFNQANRVENHGAWRMKE
jgi:hypothetical protein